MRVQRASPEPFRHLDQPGYQRVLRSTAGGDQARRPLLRKMVKSLSIDQLEPLQATNLFARALLLADKPTVVGAEQAKPCHAFGRPGDDLLRHAATHGMACDGKAFRRTAKYEPRHFRDRTDIRILCDRDLRNFLKFGKLRFIVGTVTQHSREQYEPGFHMSPHISRKFQARVGRAGSAHLRDSADTNRFGVTHVEGTFFADAPAAYCVRRTSFLTLPVA